MGVGGRGMVARRLLHQVWVAVGKGSCACAAASTSPSPPPHTHQPPEHPCACAPTRLLPAPLPSPLPSPPPCSIFPYSAAQLSSNDHYKRLFADDHGELTVPKRLLSGACAGMTATALTHPLDTMRLRLALPNHGYRGGSVGRWVGGRQLSLAAPPSTGPAASQHPSHQSTVWQADPHPHCLHTTSPHTHPARARTCPAQAWPTAL